MNLSLQVNVSYLLRLLILVLVFIISAMTELETHADWTDIGKVNGVQVYRDNDNNLEWTTPLKNRARTFQSAQQQVANLGFRLPTHREFRSLEHNGGINRLRIPTGLGIDFFWESTGKIVNGNGGNFERLLPANYIRLVQANWVIGVRHSVGNNGNTTPPVVPGGNSPKVHMLFVWGTKATDTYWSTMISKGKMEEALATPHDQESGVGLGKNEPHVANYITLEGDNATAKNINDISWKLSQAAGPNDAVFVYILCHGATTYEDNDTNKQNRIHILSPNCNNAQDMRPRELGIRRSTIWKNITSKQHRLNMLITDSCTPIFQEGAALPNPLPPVPNTESALYKVLMEGHGSLNINSTDPNGNHGKGEVAMGWVPIISGQTGNSFLEEAIHDYYGSGTVFTNAFIGCAKVRIDIKDSYPIDQFYSDLKEGLVAQFNLLIDFLDKTSDSSIVKFVQQGTQTLTKFYDNGVAIKNEPE